MDLGFLLWLTYSKCFCFCLKSAGALDGTLHCAASDLVRLQYTVSPLTKALFLSSPKPVVGAKPKAFGSVQIRVD